MIQPENTHLAQLNSARALDDMDSALLADFAAGLDRVNTIAERSEGFVWRLKDDSGNATGIRLDGADDPRLLINMSVWVTPEHLEQFVWNTIHKQFYNKKAKWFAAPTRIEAAMWWIPAGHIPTLTEAEERLVHIRTHGPTERAFGWESLPNVQLWREQRCA